MTRYVMMSQTSFTRDWFTNVKYLQGKRLRVIREEGDYIVFKDSHLVRGYRCWHKSNLRFIENKLVLENK